MNTMENSLPQKESQDSLASQQTGCIASSEKPGSPASDIPEDGQRTKKEPKLSTTEAAHISGLSREHKGGRHLGLGGSNFSTICGLNPYESLFDLWLGKTCKYDSGFSENKFTYWGKAIEGAVANKYSEDTGLELIESIPGRDPLEMKRMGSKEWVYGSPDRLLVAPEGSVGVVDGITGRTLMRRGLEIKTGLGDHRYRWADEWFGFGDLPPITNFEDAHGRVPLYYWCQCQWYMEVMDFPEWDLVVLLDSSDYRWFRVLRDEEFMSEMLPAAESFWYQHVVADVPPTIDHGKMVNRYLADLHPEPSEAILRAVDVSEQAMIERLFELGESKKAHGIELSELRDQRKELSKKIREWQLVINEEEDKYRAIGNKLKSVIGNNEGISHEGKTVSWKKQINKKNPKKWTRRLSRKLEK